MEARENNEEVSMCVVSMVGDHYRDKWIPTWQFPDQPFKPFDPEKRRNDREDIVKILTGQPISREEFDALKREVEELKELLKRAVQYDNDTGQADCETDSKMALLRKIAQAVGIDLDEILAAK